MIPIRKLVLATRNQGKVREIQAILDGLPLDIISLMQLDNVPEVEEDQSTFSGNALKKAAAVAEVSGLPSLADDSGLMVKALGGRPGVLSARFAGPGADDAANNRLLLTELQGIPPESRGATFVCALALILPGKEQEKFLIEEYCHGRIAESLLGSGGFGYDPLFIFEPSGLTFAEMREEAKNRVSHRGKALKKLRVLLQELAL